MNESIQRELRVLVERAVRPVRASLKRKRRMREELFEHVAAVFDEEFERCGDEREAVARTSERFGEPAPLTDELQATVPKSDRLQRLADPFAYRAGESPWELAARVTLVCLAFHAVIISATVLPFAAFKPMFETVLVIRLLLAIAFVSAVLAFVTILLTERIALALWGDAEERSLRKAIGYLGLSMLVFPMFAIGTHLALLSGFSGVNGNTLICCGVSALIAPIVFVLMAREMIKEIRFARDWAGLELDE